MFVVRAARVEDVGDLLDVARHLDSVNLPNDRAALSEQLRRSELSFAATSPGDVERHRREYLFVLEEWDAGGTRRVVGSSLIFAQHGSRRAPHVYFDVIEEERYSETLDRHFAHKVLRIGYSYRGLTEIGGLVLLPGLRHHPEQLGKTLAYVRFLFMALHRPFFCDEVVSELMPPLQADGTSLLWEALGRNFTGLSYQEADRLSRENKEFIRTLFPEEPIYACLLPPAAQGLIGQVGESSRGVETMLRRIGFRYASRIDPFDGGPHFHARLDEVTLVGASRTVRVGPPLPDPATGAVVPESFAERAYRGPALVAHVRSTPPFFRALRTDALAVGEGAAGMVRLPAPVLRALDVEEGAEVGLLPLLPSGAPASPWAR